MHHESILTCKAAQSNYINVLDGSISNRVCVLSTIQYVASIVDIFVVALHPGKAVFLKVSRLVELFDELV